MECRKEMGLTDDIISIEYTPQTGKHKGNIYEQFYKGESARLFAWLRDTCIEMNGQPYRKQRLGTYWNFTRSLNNLTKEGSVKFPNGKKPEALISRIFYMATEPGDLVMDSFLGSGTTAAVAHKLGLNYIGIEMGVHCETKCYKRLKNVVDGEQSGISKELKWLGGGGFRFYRLGTTFFNSNGLISRDVEYKHLAAHIWFSETYKPINTSHINSAFLGIDRDTAYVIIHRDVCDTDILSSQVFKTIRAEIDQIDTSVSKVVIYAESSRMGQAKMRERGIVFKQIPYDIKTK